MRVLIAGGGTAGHVSPSLALAHALVEGHADDVCFVGTRAGLESRLVPAEGFRFEPIEAAPFVRGISLRNLVAPFVVMRSVRKAAPLVESADVVVGMGGYVSVPVAIAALRHRRPLVLHEQNAIPGLANRILARAARTVAVSFADAARHLPRRAHVVVTGNPVRPRIAAVASDREALRKEAFEEFDLEPGRRTVLVFGGSQGARRVDRAVADALPSLGRRADVQLLVSTGPAHLDVVRDAIPAGSDLVVRALPFIERMDLAYAVADLVVSRAGANSVAEIAVCGLPSVLVPYPYATAHHQDANARALARAGAAAVVRDDALSGDVLASRVGELLDDAERRQRMGARAAMWAHADAADALARAVDEAAR